MTNKKTSLWKSVDWITILLFVILITAGWISIYGASYDLDNPNYFDLSVRPGQQLLWIGIAAVLIFMILMVDKHFFETFAYIMYGSVLLLLLVTIFVAPEIKGGRSWLVITPFIRFQPVEFAKFATLLALAKFMNSYEFYLLKVRNFLLSACIIFLPMALVIFQHDTGSALVFLSLALVFYREGMSGYALLSTIGAILCFIIKIKYDNLFWNDSPVGELIVACLILVIICIILRFVLKKNKLSYYFLGIVLTVGFISYIASFFLTINLLWVAIALIAGFSIYLIIYSIKVIESQYALLALFALLSLGFLFSVDYVFDEVLAPHHQQRIKVVLGLKDDPSGVGYNVNQSKIAIGSGGLYGKGFLNGTQTKLKYVPEHATDFIFCTIGEEFGFWGSASVIIIFCLLLLRMIVLAERQNTTFGRVYGYGVVSIFLFHIVVNIGMVTGLTPVIGIPLPFFSYGGSSLLGFTILLFIFLRIDSGRKEEY